MSKDLSEKLGEIRTLISDSSDPKDAYSALCRTLIELDDIVSVNIALMPSVDSDSFTTICGIDGSIELAKPIDAQEFVSKKTIIDSMKGEYTGHRIPFYHGSKLVGCMNLVTTTNLDEETIEQIAKLQADLSIIFKSTLSETEVSNLEARLQILNYFNGLIASKAHLDMICRTIARESAFRFGADCAFTLLPSKDRTELEIVGSFGCNPRILPASLSMRNEAFGKTFELGGTISFPHINTKNDEELQFLANLGINNIYCCSINSQDESIGEIVLGFKDEYPLSVHDNLILQEICKGAAVAIQNCHSQAELTAYTEKLEEIVAERTADLKVQTQKAESANLAKSRFVANMSHELRTPLTAVIGYASVLSSGLFGSVTEKQKEALTSISKASEHLKELIDEILNLSKIEAGKEDAEPSRVDLYPLLKQIYKLMLQQALTKKIKLNLVAPTDGSNQHKLLVDPRHIRQILINLTSNAIKYTQDEGTVTIDAEIMADKARINVRDTGVGIAEEQIEKLFERFERGENEYNLLQSGTGIGLSLTRHLTEINGGRIGVESELGKGSTFWVLMPLADTSAILEEEESDSEICEANNIEGLDILILDDNIATCDVLSTIVENQNARPYVAYTVVDAKKIISEHKIDIALVDLAIPGESGLEFIEHIKNHEDDAISKIPIIVVSACVYDNDKESAMAAGANMFIAKPFRPAEIISAVRRVVTSSILGLDDLI